jgi:hypothetical protein
MDNAESFPFIVVYKIFDIFQQENLGLVVFYNSGDIKKKRSLGFAPETMSATK